MRADRFPIKSATEQDVLTGWRKWYCYTQRAGVAKGIKRQYRRRVRRRFKDEDRRAE